jgi:deoxyribonuclease-2
MGLTIPDIYDSRTSSGTPAALAALAAGRVSKQPFCNSTSIQTIGGTAVTHFAKSTAWNNELYSACIAPGLQQSLFAETWIRGSAVGPSCSGNFHVNDVKTLDLPFNDSFKETQDHSKWAVGLTYVCIADINRMTTQYKRGGGAFCVRDARLALALNATIVTANGC